MSEAPDPVVQELDEGFAGVEVRTKQFMELGYADYVAWCLAMQPHVSLSEVRELIRKGCPPSTAASIVL